jgi:hypothetical protein
MTMMTGNTTTMKSTMTSRPKHKGTADLTQILLLGSMFATLAGAYLLARQDQGVGPATAATAQTAYTLVVPAAASVDGMTLNLQPVPTLVPAPQRLPVRPVARTRSSR